MPGPRPGPRAPVFRTPAGRIYAAPTCARRRGRGCRTEGSRSGQDRSLHGTRERRIVGRGLDPSGQPGGGRRAVGAGRLAAHSERRQPAKLARSCGCLPRGGKHCSLPGFAPLNRGPTLTTPQCPAPTTQLGSSSASTRQPFSVGTNRTVVTVAVSGTIVSSPAQPAKSSLSQVSTT